MKSQWRTREAETMVRDYARKGVNRDIALRVYTTRLLGQNPKLVLHGGGNTSVKTTLKDVLGEPVEVLCVKGSGWDMGDIEPGGLPALRLSELHKLRNLSALSDEEMGNYQRGCLLDSTSPNPSVETLLHAFLPQKYLDHTHSTAVLAIIDQPNGAALCRELSLRHDYVVSAMMSLSRRKYLRGSRELRMWHPFFGASLPYQKRMRVLTGAGRSSNFGLDGEYATTSMVKICPATAKLVLSRLTIRSVLKTGPWYYHPLKRVISLSIAKRLRSVLTVMSVDITDILLVTTVSAKWKK